ncbi:MAG TPA: hypothetical protein GXZ90_02945, partial [Clostridiales bacterium]|nr:hypothetical protein [Clostridiales bacterium]
SFSDNENRYLALRPSFNWGDLKAGEYTADYERFVIDQFVFRDNWIGLKTISERFLLKQEINSVYIAKEEYLIERHDKSTINKEQEEVNIQRLIEFIKKYDNKYMSNVNLMLVPTASEILVDKLPLFANGYDQLALIDRINKELGNKNILVDISDTLKSHSNEYIYYKTDHHWTSLGAYYAYEKWVVNNGVQPIARDEFDVIELKDFYGTLYSKININIKPDIINLYKIKKDMGYIHISDNKDKSNSLYDLSKLNIKDKYSVFLGGNHSIDEITTNNKNGKSLLLIKDSFAHSIIPFICNHFEKVYLIDLRYFNTSLETFIEEKEITDILVLYNVINYVKDNNASKLLK